MPRSPCRRNLNFRIFWKICLRLFISTFLTNVHTHMCRQEFPKMLLVLILQFWNAMKRNETWPIFQNLPIKILHSIPKLQNILIPYFMIPRNKPFFQDGHRCPEGNSYIHGFSGRWKAKILLFPMIPNDDTHCKTRSMCLFDMNKIPTVYIIPKERL